MKESPAVRDGLCRFYERFSAHDAHGFDAIVASEPGISVIGSAPGEGHDTRDAWVSTYRDQILAAGIRLEGADNSRAWEEGTVGFALDEPRFVMPDGSYLPTRLTAVLHQEDGAWRIVHAHFSVGVPDEEAIRPPD